MVLLIVAFSHAISSILFALILEIKKEELMLLHYILGLQKIEKMKIIDICGDTRATHSDLETAIFKWLYFGKCAQVLFTGYIYRSFCEYYTDHN